MEIKSKEKNTVSFDLVLKDKDIKDAETEVYKKNKKSLQVPGFRKGHVPRKLIENMYGKDVFLEDAINEILPEVYAKAVKELKLDVIDQPNIDIPEERKDGEDLIVNVKVDVKPEAKLGEYKGLEIEDPTMEVTDEVVMQEVENEREKNARIINVDDRAAQKGDSVNIDYKGSCDGEYFKGGEDKGHDLELGSGAFIEGFEDQIIGHKVGEEFDINVKFPEDYRDENLKGKEAKFEIKLNGISYKELPKLDDEFVKDISEFDTLEEYKEDIRKNKQEEYDVNAKMEKQRRIVEKLGEIAEVEVPEVMVNRQIDEILQNYERSLMGQGISLEDYIKMTGSSIEAMRESLKEGAKNTVKNDLALDALVKAENIKISDEDVEKEVNEVVEDYFKDDKEHMEKMRSYMLNENKEQIRDDLAKRKAVDIILESAKLVEPKKLSEEEAQKAKLAKEEIEKLTEEENK